MLFEAVLYLVLIFSVSFSAYVYLMVQGNEKMKRADENRIEYDGRWKP